MHFIINTIHGGFLAGILGFFVWRSVLPLPSNHSLSRYCFGLFRTNHLTPPQSPRSSRHVRFLLRCLPNQRRPPRPRLRASLRSQRCHRRYYRSSSRPASQESHHRQGDTSSGLSRWYCRYLLHRSLVLPGLDGHGWLGDHHLGLADLA